MLGYNKPLSVSFGNPVKDFDLKALSLTTRTKKDTNSIVPEAFFTDSIHRHLMIIHAWKSEENYDLYIPRTSFIDIYSDTCDSTHVAFQTKSIDDYGNFAMLINRKVIDCPIIVQLMSEKGTILDQKTITNEKRIDFGLLPPGKYSLKAIMDANANGRWDTGKFLKKIQPERVLVHPKIFEVRTNWELEETWDL